MSIGSYTSKLPGSPVKRTWKRIFGTLDLHSHTRLRPVLRHAERYSTGRRPRTIRALEVGCGAGTNLFELAQRVPGLTGVGFDVDSEAVTVADRTARQLFPNRLAFLAADACRDSTRGEFDIILLIDVLEHLATPKAVLEMVSRRLRPGGELLVSVPTPRFPRVFGERFHRAIGHVVPGYDLPALNALVPRDLELVAHQYNTGLVASIPCALYYRMGRWWPPTPWARGFLTALHLLRPADVLNGPGRSCSLFAAYRRIR